MNGYNECTLCPRECRVNRSAGVLGFCNMSDTPVIARASLHKWEEPCISGETGSGTVFFSGCNLHCIYCQNYSISFSAFGKSVDCERLCEIFFELKEKGACNINFVTPTHFLPHVRESIKRARNMGFDLPFVYNSSGYDSVEQIRTLEGLIDIYLPDYKYSMVCDAAEYSHASDYPSAAMAAIDEMVRQQGEAVFDGSLMKRGVIIRHLLLPGKLIASKIALKRIYSSYGDSVYISIMSQYTPMPHLKEHPILGRKVKYSEYKSLCDHALSLRIKNAYIQDVSSVGECYIPDFDGRGI